MPRLPPTHLEMMDDHLFSSCQEVNCSRRKLGSVPSSLEESVNITSAVNYVPINCQPSADDDYCVGVSIGMDNIISDCKRHSILLFL